MTENVRYKSLEISLICYIIAGIILWTVLFLLSPKYIEFSISKEKAQRIPNIENRKVIINDLDIKSFEEYLKKENEAKQTQETVGGSLFVYGIAGFLIIFLFEKKIIHKLYLPIIITFFIINYFIANLYYNIIFRPFAGIMENFLEYFVFIKALPFILFIYLAVRSVILRFSGEEPKFVGELEFFTDPFNWLFTVIVMLSGIIAGFLVPWF